MMSFLRWVAFTLVLAALVHWATVYFLPIVIVSTAHSRIAAQAGSNIIAHGPRVDETARQVVRPSPDLLYSICAFDLSEGPVRFTAPVPEGTYASLSFYGLDSTNFYAESDRSAAGDRFDVILVAEGTQPPSGDGSHIVLAPGAKGIALFRTLITDEIAFPRLDAARREAGCAPVSEG